MKFLPEKKVRSEIQSAGSRAFTIEFQKKDGTLRKVNVMPRVQKRRVGGAAGPAATPKSIQNAARQKQTLAQTGMIYMDRPHGGGVSFHPSKVTRMWIDGAEIAAR